MTRRLLPTLAVCAVLLGVIVLLGALHPVRPASVATDRLGPDSGEAVADYLQRARRSLQEAADEVPPRPHWALVSFAAPVTTTQLPELLAPVRVSQVLFRVPIDRVQTPLVVVGVGGNPASLERSDGVAAAQLQAGSGGEDRRSRIAAVSATRLAQRCACVVGATVRGTGDRLRVLAENPVVRGVEVLPADAVFGRFAVRPLLPDHTDIVAPGPDDGPV